MLSGSFLKNPSVRRWLCAMLDFGIILSALFAAVMFRFSYSPAEIFRYELLAPKGLLLAFVLQICFYYAELYEDRVMRRGLEFLLRLAQSFVVAALLLSLLYYAVPGMEVGRGILILFAPLAVGAVFLRRGLYLWMFESDALSDSVLILGTGQTAQQVAREMLRRAPLGYRVTGFLGEHRAEVGRRLVNPSVVGTVADLVRLVDELKVTLIVVALENRRGKLPVAELLRCRVAGVRVEEAPSFYENLTGKILLRNLRPSWLVFSPGFNKPRLLRSSKVLVELLVASALLVLTAPLMGFLALLIRMDSPGPVLYGQERVGEKGRRFRLYKLRTMRMDAEAKSGPVWAADGLDPRVTRVGYWLRKTRLDELPQLLNVLRGEMSFVGPRPERPHFVEQLEKVIPYYRERHGVRPGITGWAQTNFRYGATIEDTEQKLQFDLYYIKHMSLVLDFVIAVKTLKVVLFGKGAR